MTEQTTDAPVVPAWELPDRLRRALRHAGIGSNEMAEYLEVSRHTISNWINGHTRPRASDLRVWADRCGVDHAWLAYGDEATTAPRSAHQRSHWCAETAPGTVELASPPLRKAIDTDDQLRAALRRRIPVSRDLTGRG